MSSLSSITTYITDALTGITNPSVTAIFKKIGEALSIPIDNTISELTNTENIINANISANNYGKTGYYVSAALAYEDGVSMVIDPITGNFIYNPVDTSKQTISQAAFDEVNLALKVAYIDPSTQELAPLPSAMLTRFKNYFRQAGNGGMEIPGIPISIVSLSPNVFNANFFITYYGAYSLTNIQTDVIAAVQAFKTSFAYNGILYIGDLIAYIKANVSGIRDVDLTDTQIDSVAFVGNTQLTAGYFIYDASILSSLATSTPYTAI